MRVWIPLLLLLAGGLSSAKSLEIYFIDTEGGQSTLLVSPSGQTLLVDTGYAGYSGRDADRIRDAAKNAHVKRIDYLLITHHHADHVGGVSNLLERLPVGTFLDHGPSVEEKDQYPKPYAAAIAKGEHQVVKPGDTIPVKGLDITVLASAGKTIARGGSPNQYCAGVTPKEDDKTENSQSVAIVVQLGKFRFADFGDLTWNKELALLCPENKAGRIDLYLTTHHGAESPKAIWGMSPRVAIMNNGPRKGGDPAGWDVVHSSPGLEDLWQIHFAMAGGTEHNSPDPFVANLEEGDPGRYLKVTAEENGSFTVYNPRNKYTKTYSAK